MTSPSYAGTVGQTSFQGAGFRPAELSGRSVLKSPRYEELDRRQTFYECTQHDSKKYDFDGRIIDMKGPGALASQPLVNSEVAPYFIPLRSRRPSAPARLGRVIVNAFTNMTFGKQRFPTLKCDGDPDTQDFAGAIKTATKLSSKMIRCRTIGGSVGTVGLSWCFDRKGRPRVEVHNGKYLFVHEWEDREELIPAHVSEVYLTAKTEWDGNRRKFVQNWYWHRRDWEGQNDILFQEVLYREGQEPKWEPDPTKSVTHNDGFCHLTWIQNLPTEDIDGLPDYDGLYELFDTIDILNSVTTKGAILNLDPTLVLKADPDIIGAMGIKKGSDNALTVGEEGGAEYLELTGSSLEAGIKLLQEQRRNGLETAQCIVPDPADIAAQGISSVALKGIFGPMIGKCETLREQYGTGMTRVLNQIVEVARAKLGQKVTIYVKNDAGEIVEQEAELTIDLPQKTSDEPKIDPVTGEQAKDPTGKPLTTTTRQDRKPGDGGEIELDWPDYFPPTPQDQQNALTSLSTAAGGKPVVSQQTAVEQASTMLGIDPTEEWGRVQKMGADDQKAAADQASAFGAGGDFQGGKPGADGLPEGAKPKPKFGGSKAPFGGGGDEGDSFRGGDGGEA